MGPIWRLMRVVALVSALAPFGAVAQAEGPDAHGWFATGTLDGPGATLLHLPPRDESVVGSAVMVRVLDQTPTLVASWERSVYLLYARRADRVEAYTIRVTPVGVSGAWMAEPPAGATALPMLDLEGAELRDAAGSGSGLAVLGHGEAWRLWVLGPRGWERRDLPASVAESERVWLVAGSARLALLTVGASSASRWSLDGDSWVREGLTTPAGFGSGRVAAVFDSGGDVCAALRGAGEDASALGVWSLGPGLAARVSEFGVPGGLAGLTAMDGGRRLVALAVVSDPSASGPREPIRHWELTEVSLVTGGVLYSGPWRQPTLAINEEVRLLSLVMMAVTASILFYLLRPAEEVPEPVVPPGFVLAPPGRRLAGGVLDGLLIAGLVSVVTGVRFADMVLVMPLFGSATGVVALVLAVASGVVYSTLGEWLAGRTLGKLVLGMRVVSVDPARPRVGLMRSGARNVFRWALAPWAVLGLGSPGLRHRGDVVAGAGVVVRDRRGA